jgi:hypothetical protein
MKNKRLQHLLAALPPASAEADAEVENLGQEVWAKLKGGALDASEEFPPKVPAHDLACLPNNG